MESTIRTAIEQWVKNLSSNRPRNKNYKINNFSIAAEYYCVNKTKIKITKKQIKRKALEKAEAIFYYN